MGWIRNYYVSKGLNPAVAQDKENRILAGAKAATGAVIITVPATAGVYYLLTKPTPKPSGDGEDGVVEEIAVEEVGLEEVVDADAFEKVASKDKDIKDQLGNGGILSVEKTNFANGSMLIEAHMKAKDNTPYDVQIELPAKKAQEVRSKLKGMPTYLVAGDDGLMEFEGQAAVDLAMNDLGLSDEDAQKVDKVMVRAYANYGDQGKSMALVKAYDANGDALDLTKDSKVLKVTDFAKIDNLVDRFDNADPNDDSTTKYTQGDNIKVLEIGDKFVEKYEWATGFAKDIGIKKDLFDEDLEEVLSEISDHLKAGADDIYQRGQWEAIFTYAANIVGMTGANGTEINENLTAYQTQKNITAAVEYLEGVVNGWIDVKQGDWEEAGKGAILNSLRASIIGDYSKYFSRVDVTEDDVNAMNETELWDLTKTITGVIEDDADEAALNAYRTFIVGNYGPDAEVDYLTKLNYTVDQVNNMSRPDLEGLEKQIDDEIFADGKGSAKPGVIDDFRNDIWNKYGPNATHNLLAIKSITDKEQLFTEQYDTTAELLDLISELEDLEDKAIEQMSPANVVTEYANDPMKLDQALTNWAIAGYEVVRFDHTQEGEMAYNNLTNNLTKDNKTFGQELGFNWSPVYEKNGWTIEIYKGPNPTDNAYATAVVRDNNGDINRDYTRVYTKDQVEYVEDHS